MNHNCGNDNVKRYLSFVPPRNGVVIFIINRYSISDVFIGNIIYPDNQIFLDKMLLKLTSIVFRADSRFAIALTVNDDQLILHDGFKAKSTVSDTQDG